jgi:hypothetical protein
MITDYPNCKSACGIQPAKGGYFVHAGVDVWEGVTCERCLKVRKRLRVAIKARE